MIHRGVAEIAEKRGKKKPRMTRIKKKAHVGSFLIRVIRAIRGSISLSFSASSLRA
jgi:hypothetical protein